MIELPAEPILATPAATYALPLNWFAEPKRDDFRAFAARAADGSSVLRSRRGGELAAASPEITDAIGQLDCSVVFDGELVAWEETRLAFEPLTQRLHRRGCRRAPCRGRLTSSLCCLRPVSETRLGQVGRCMQVPNPSSFVTTYPTTTPPLPRCSRCGCRLARTAFAPGELDGRTARAAPAHRGRRGRVGLRFLGGVDASVGGPVQLPRLDQRFCPLGADHVPGVRELLLVALPQQTGRR
ncbi:hypothetical protein AB0I84_31745 [Streptomyces spectabilis]|uniref:ATP-dependent DNA ligase n=1 Tax=Streptomyces spectabilis TaxID=68270 RepID=UPI0033DD0D8D